MAVPEFVSGGILDGEERSEVGRNEGKLDTLIGPETIVKGDLRVGGSLRLEGQIEGRVDVAETLQTGSRSLLKGEVHARECIIAGRVEGDIHSSENTELQSGANVRGNIYCKGLVIQRDCIFQGSCSMAVAADDTAGSREQS